MIRKTKLTLRPSGTFSADETYIVEQVMNRTDYVPGNSIGKRTVDLMLQSERHLTVIVKGKKIT